MGPDPRLDGWGGVFLCCGWSSMKLDAYDIKILSILQRNGRITKLKLAEAIHLSPSPCWERLRRLEVAGIIRGYHADVAIERLAQFSMIWVEVHLHSHYADDFGRFEKAVGLIPEIVECYAVGGGVDYLLKVICRDIDHYQQLIDGLLLADIRIERYFTYVVTKSVKCSPGLPIERLLASDSKELVEGE
jgi:Lrp/AsnC family transcriptional regulator of ectoine degradation